MDIPFEYLIMMLLSVFQKVIIFPVSLILPIPESEDTDERARVKHELEDMFKKTKEFILSLVNW